jgi:hypothetical protein
LIWCVRPNVRHRRRTTPPTKTTNNNNTKGHMSMLLGAAKLLKEREADIKGTVLLVFQPAEEGGAGARAFCVFACCVFCARVASLPSIDP